MSWQQLVSILEEAREVDAQEAAKTPVECPNDYTTLQTGPGGVLFCPWDGWQYPGDA